MLGTCLLFAFFGSGIYALHKVSTDTSTPTEIEEAKETMPKATRTQKSNDPKVLYHVTYSRIYSCNNESELEYELKRSYQFHDLIPEIENRGMRWVKEEAMRVCELQNCDLLA